MDVSNIHAGTIITDVSDHFSVCALFNSVCLLNHYTKCPPTTLISYKQFQKALFLDDLATLP